MPDRLQALSPRSSLHQLVKLEARSQGVDRSAHRKQGPLC